MIHNLHFRHGLTLTVLAIMMLLPGLVRGATPYAMSGGDYSEAFTNIASTTNWPANFGGTDCMEWGSVAVNATGTIGDGIKTTVSTVTFSTSSSGGVQRGSANIYMLSTSTSNACAIELFLDFTGRNAGTISFDLAEVTNGSGDRDSKMKLFYSTNGTTYTEITGTNLPFTARNGVASSASITAIALPAAFNNSATARLRFYEYSTTGGATPTGSQPKISIDNIAVTSTSTSNTAPILTASAVSAIGTTSATFNGNISSDGGSAITARGFSYKTSTGVALGDNQTLEGGTTTGSYSKSMTLSAGTSYFYKAYATNGIGTTLSSNEISFWTFSTEPLTHTTSFTNSVVSQTQLNVFFNALSTITNASGYLILQRVGGNPTGVPADGSSYSVGTAIGDGTVAAIVTNTSVTSASITSLAAGTHYYFMIFPFNNGANNATYNYKTDGSVPSTNGTTAAPLDATSEISGPALGSQPNPVLISSLATTAGTAVQVLDMDVYDYGPDGESTQITQLTIKAGTNNTANWANSIQGVKLSLDGGSTFVTIGTPTIAAASIVIPITAGNLDIADADAQTISLFVYLKSSGLTDNAVLEFKVDATAASHGCLADATGSTFMATFTTAPVSNQMLIDVVATKLNYVQQPSNAAANAAMAPAVKVEATDANSNRDLNYSTPITITSTGALSGSPVTGTLASGLATFTLVHTANGSGLILTAASGSLASITSNSFAISSLLLVEDFNYTASTLLTTNGWTTHSAGANPITVGAPTISYPDYLSSGVGNEVSLATSGEDDNRTFTAVASGTLYASFLVNVSSATTTGDYFFHLGQTAIGTTFKARVFVKKDAASNNLAFGIAQSTAVANYTAFSYALNTTYLVTIKYTIVSGATNDVASIYVNPALNSVEPSTGWISNTDAAGTDLTEVGSVALRQGSSSNAAALKLDGIRISTVWSDIVGALALPTTYTGTGNWSTAGNWSNGIPLAVSDATVDGDVTIDVAAATKNLTINSGKSVTISSGKSLKVNGTFVNSAGAVGLVVNSGGSLIESNGVAATVERDITTDVYHSFSPSVGGVTANLFHLSGLTGLDVYLYGHVEANNAAPDGGYYEITAISTPLAPFTGYTVYADGVHATPPVSSWTFTEQGNLNSGTYGSASIMSRTGAGGVSSFAGFNFIGNPYPSFIDWTASSGWTKTNMDATIYVEHGATWASYTAPGPGVNSGSNILSPGQGFFVRVSTGNTSGTVIMTNDVRTQTSTPYLKSSATDYVKLVVTGNEKSDETVVRFDANATANYDGQYDAAKLDASDVNYPQIYSVADAKLAYNALPETDLVQLGFAAGVSGDYTIAMNDYDNISAVSLEDTQTGLFTDLTKGSYTFSYVAGENDQRFKLHFGSLSVNETGNSIAIIYSNSRTVYVDLKDNVKGDIFVYTVAGQLVSTTKAALGINKVSMANTGNYIVKVITDKSTMVKKVFIQ